MRYYLLVLVLICFILSSTKTEPEILVSIPTVTTEDVTGITSVSAMVSGLIADNGGAIVTARGFVWDTIANPVLGSSNSVFIGGSTESFSGIIQPLVSPKTHYVRAFAINTEGTAYGENKAFKPPFNYNRVLNLYSSRPADTAYGKYSMATNFRLRSDVYAQDLVLPDGVHCFVKFTSVSGIATAEVNGIVKRVYTNDTIRVSSQRVALEVKWYIDSTGLHPSNCMYEIRIGGKAVIPGSTYNHVFSVMPNSTNTTFWNTLKTLTQFSQPYLP